MDETEKEKIKKAVELLDRAKERNLVEWTYAVDRMLEQAKKLLMSML